MTGVQTVLFRSQVVSSSRARWLSLGVWFQKNRYYVFARKWFQIYRENSKKRKQKQSYLWGRSLILEFLHNVHILHVLSYHRIFVRGLTYCLKVSACNTSPFLWARGTRRTTLDLQRTFSKYNMRRKAGHHSPHLQKKSGFRVSPKYIIFGVVGVVHCARGHSKRPRSNSHSCVHAYHGQAALHSYSPHAPR